MPNYIEKIDVDGTEYDVVGPGSQYPISVQNTLASDGYYSDGHPEVSFYWQRIGTEGNYEYTLVITTGGTDPEYYTYSDGTDS